MRNAIFFLVVTAALCGCRQKRTHHSVAADPHNVPMERRIRIAPMEKHRKRPRPKDGKYPVMRFTAAEFDFGTIEQGAVVSHDFHFTNTGQADLIIDEAHGSCGCTVPQYPKEPIAPGESATIKVTFSSAHKEGMQHKSVFLMTNTQAVNEVLKIKVNINPSAAIRLPITNQK